MESKNIFELPNAETQTDELAVHGLTEFVEIIVEKNIMTQTAASGIPVVTESGEAPLPADDGRWAEHQEEFEIVDDNDQIIVQKQIIVQEEIIAQE